MKIENIGLIGLGKHGVRYARHICEDFPGLRLHAISRRDAAQLTSDEAQWGARGFVDYRALIAEGGCDALIAVVPPFLHLDIVQRATDAGLPLLLEKPAAANWDDALAMAGCVAGRIMVAQTLRYNEVVRALRERIAEVGEVSSISLTQRFEPSTLEWLDDPQRSGAGIALHTGVHSFDLLRYFTGREAVRVTAQVSRQLTRETEDGCAATVEMEGGLLATVSLARTTRGRTGHIEIAGREAALTGDHVFNCAYLVRGRERTPIEVGKAIPTVREIVGDFVECLEGDRPFPISLADGLAAIAVSDACLRSAQSGAVADVYRLEGVAGGR